jgi:hypothetical protein
MKKILLAILALPFIGSTQISITGSGSSTQDFNTLASSGTAIPWVDNSTIPNWYAQRSGTGTAYNTSNGSGNGGNLYSFGVNLESDRSLGSIGSSNAAAGDFASGVQLQNNAATNVTSISVSFTMEQWRNGGSTLFHTLSFYYKKSSTLITALDPDNNGTWTAVNALDVSAPIASATSAALVGNDPANKVVLTNISIPGLVLLPGEYVMLKWDDPDHPGGDHGLSIDDVTITYSVTCETFSFLTETACNEFTLNSTTYNASGIYQQVLDNANIYGCDSTITLDLTIDPLVTYYEDQDGDNYGNSSSTITSCVPVVGYVTVAGDCNDNNNTVYPGAFETCDLIDNDCDGFIDELGDLTYYLDSDGDGFGDPATFIVTCTPPVGYVLNGTDCDDSESNINPGVTEVCNGIDDNCDGNIDEGVLITFYEDLDNDGYGNSSVTFTGCSAPIGFVTASGDCNDNDDEINPGAPEICNGSDENCNGNIDEGALVTYFEDLDGDNYGNSSVSVTACSAPLGYVIQGGDCDETNPSINPGATDIIGNGIDEDCSGSDATNPLIGIYEFTGAAACPNLNVNVTAQPTTGVFSAFSSMNTGCIAAANVFNNDGWNTTATIDLSEYNEFTLTANDCQEMTLSKLTFDHRNSGSGNVTWIVRSSVDNFATNVATGQSSSTVANQEVTLGAEFSGLSSVIFRFYVTNAAAAGTTWRQDNVSLFGIFTALTPQTFYADADNDSFGDVNTSVSVCSPPAGYVTDNTDCDDTDENINPLTVWFEDGDGDLIGNSANSFTGCIPPNNTYVLVGNDCDDTDNSIGAAVAYYIDTDNDGYGSESSTATLLCTNPGAGYSTNNSDCDDAENTVYPGAPELCDGLDNDCNGQEDDGLTFLNYFLDADEDGFGSGNAINACESPGANYVQEDGDCDDTDDSIYPGATEIMDDSIDQNCDGIDGYVGIDEINEWFVNIVPNPSNGLVTVNFNQNVNAEIVVTDFNGKICLESRTVGSTNTYDLSKLTDGLYIMKITSEFGNIQKRLIIQK